MEGIQIEFMKIVEIKVIEEMINNQIRKINKDRETKINISPNKIMTTLAHLIIKCINNSQENNFHMNNINNILKSSQYFYGMQILNKIFRSNNRIKYKNHIKVGVTILAII